jgi:hypothetical protein
VEEREFKCRNGKTVLIKIDEITYDVQVFTAAGEKLGGMQFRLIEGYRRDYLKLTGAFFDRLGGEYLRQGVGRECLRRVAELSGYLIAAESDDGQRKADGSHLTGDAQRFVSQMRKEGFIVPEVSQDEL